MRQIYFLSEPGFIYTRLNNPTNDILGTTALEGIAVVTASGTAAPQRYWFY
jgi:O-acetylhomoserine (thiol)-lyase